MKKAYILAGSLRTQGASSPSCLPHGGKCSAQVLVGRAAECMFVFPAISLAQRANAAKWPQQNHAVKPEQEDFVTAGQGTSFGVSN